MSKRRIPLLGFRLQALCVHDYVSPPPEGEGRCLARPLRGLGLFQVRVALEALSDFGEDQGSILLAQSCFL